MAINDDSIDFTPNRRSNNNKNMRASKSNVENENREILEGLSLQSKKIEEVNKKKLDGEKRVTAEKQKQNKEDDKQLKLQNQQASIIKNFQRTQDQIIKSQYNQTEILKNIAILMDNSKKSMEEELKHQRELLKEQKEKTSAMQDYYDKLNKNYDEQKSYEKQLSEMAKSHADFQGQELKKLQSHQIGLWKQQQKNLKDQQDLQQAINSGYMKSTDEIKRRFTELKDIQEDIAKEQEETAKRIERSKALADKRTGLKDRAFKGFGFNTDSDIFKYFSQRRTASPEDKKFLAASAKLEVASAAIETATKAITKFATLWLDRFTSGMDRIVGVYEDTYSEVAAISGVNESGYTKWQNETAKLLMQNNVDNAVTISQAMTELHRLTKEGFTDMNKASEMSIQNIQNRIINPFVDTTTDAYENLQYQFGSKFTKQITGMSGYLNQMVGSNRVFSKSIDTVIENLEPVALSAKKDLLGDSYAIAEALVKEGGMTQKQAIELVSKASNAVADPYAALMSNDVAEKAAAAYGHVNNMGEFIRSYLGTASIASSSNPYFQGAALDSMGITAFSSRTDINKVVSIANNVDKLAKNSTLTPGSVYEKSLQKLANGDYTTALQEKANVAENAATFAATLREQWPDAYEILKGILQGLGQIVMAVVGGHLFSGATNLLGGGKGLGGLFGGAGKHAATGGAKTALTGGLQKLGGGLATGTSGSVGAGLAVAGGAVAGGAMAAYGATEAVKDFKNGDIGYGVGNAVGAAGGAIGAGALIALGASNPVGWVALAVGALALGAVALGKEIDRVKESFDASKKSQEQLDAANRRWTEESKKQLKPLENYGVLIQQTTDVETAKKLIVDAGIKTEQELQNEQYNSLDALKKLTETYIQSKRDLAEADVSIKNSIMGANQSEKTELANFMSAIMDKGSVNDLTDAEKKLLNTYGQQAVEYINKLKEAGTLDDDVNKHWKYLYDKGITDSSKYNFYDDNFHANDYWILTHAGNNADRRQQMQDLMTSSATSDYYYNVVAGGNGNLFTGAGYRTLDVETAAKYVRDIIDAGNMEDKGKGKSAAESAIQSLKLGGYNTIDTLGGSAKQQVQDAMDKLGIEKYQTGSNFIPYNQLALLHRGESVLTASATSDLKEFLGTENIKDFSGEVMNQTLSSGLGSFSSVIADQTRVLVNKIDEVIMTIRDGRTGVLTSVMTDAEREQFAL